MIDKVAHKMNVENLAMTLHEVYDDGQHSVLVDTSSTIRKISWRELDPGRQLYWRRLATRVLKSLNLTLSNDKRY